MAHTGTFVAGVVVAMALVQAPPADRKLTTTPGTISPDARLISYFEPSGPELRVDEVGSQKPVAHLAVSGYIGTSAISWDGRQVAFSSGIAGEGAGLRVLALPPSADSSPKLLLKGPDIDPVEWSRDGRHLLVESDGNQFEIRLVDVADGTFRVLKTMKPSSNLRYLALSPDSSWLAYDQVVAGAGRNRAVFLLPTNGGAETQVLEPTAWHSVIGWSPDGREVLLFSDRLGSPSIWALPVRDGRAARDLRLIKRDFDGNPKAVTSDGDIVYERVSGPPAARVVTARIDGEARLTSAPQPYATRDPIAFARFPRWSPDGTSFMYLVARLLSPAVVVHSTSTGASRELPLPLDGIDTFDVSPDGRSVVFKANLEGRPCFCIFDMATGNVRPLVLGAYLGVGIGNHPQFSTDGRRVSYFVHLTPESAPARDPAQPRHWSYVERNIETGEVRPLVSDLSRLMADPRAWPAGRSPDGRYLLARVADATSRLLAQDTKTGDVRDVYRVAGGEAFNHNGDLQWTPDSRAIITTIATVYHDDGNEQELWWIPIDGRPAHKIDVGTTLIGEDPIAIHPDGHRIAFVAGWPFNAQLPFDVRPAAVGSPVELRILRNRVP